MDMTQVKINVQGRVQGVGFRYCTKMLADQLHISGYAKNLDDGSVEILAEGNPEDIAQFIEEVKKSPSPSGHVTHYSVQTLYDKIFQPGFRIL